MKYTLFLILICIFNFNCSSSNSSTIKQNKKEEYSHNYDQDFIDYVKSKWNGHGQSFVKVESPKFVDLNAFYAQLKKGDEHILSDSFLTVPSTDFLFAHYIATKLSWNSFNQGTDKLSVDEVISQNIEENPDRNEMLAFYYKAIFSNVLNNQSKIEPYEKNIDFQKIGLNNQESAILFLSAMRHLGSQMSSYSSANFPNNCFRADIFLTKMPKFNGKLYYQYELPEFEDFQIKIDKRFPKTSFKQEFIPKFIAAKADYEKCLNNKN